MRPEKFYDVRKLIYCKSCKVKKTRLKVKCYIVKDVMSLRCFPWWVDWELLDVPD